MNRMLKKAAETSKSGRNVQARPKRPSAAETSKRGRNVQARMSRSSSLPLLSEVLLKQINQAFNRRFHSELFLYNRQTFLSVVPPEVGMLS
jgi:hypothetical protein